MATSASDALRLPFRHRYVYAAKFLCGELKASPKLEGPVRPGSYSTAINVHNPHSHPVAFAKKAVLLYDGRHPEGALERPMPPVRREQPVVVELGPDWGLEIDCQDIRRVLLEGDPASPPPPAPVFMKGWVVIETFLDVALDVVAVYTSASAGTPGTVTPSLAIDRVAGNRVLLFP
jgi:hypothetical protein